MAINNRTKAKEATQAIKERSFLKIMVMLLCKIFRRNNDFDTKKSLGFFILKLWARSAQILQVMKLLHKTVKVKAKNLDGKTAMDILQTHLLVSQKQEDFSTMLKKDYFVVRQRLLPNTLLGLSNLSITRDMSQNTSDHRGAILVVAILIVTATYQASLSPPGGFWQDNFKPGDETYHIAGQMTMPFASAAFFVFLNGFAFLSSLYVIIIIIIGLLKWKLIYGSTAALSTATLAAYITIFPSDTEYVFMPFFIFICALIIGAMMFATLMAFIADKHCRLRVDFPARCFSSSQEPSL